MDQQVKQERLQGRLGPEIKEFRQERRTLQLATVDAEGRPNVSYAPYVQNQEGYFVLISKIARHARNLLENPNVSLMMIEDEESSKQLFARKRLTFDAVANVVERDTEMWQQVVGQMKER
ncbi:pyridoxamine 5'-phosphate oxidase family protein, partial [Vibrio parahaemolyticus]|nr:pyridoxamine 5'-phosphate oxidase family protein [Vibrio parahaemolyticus]